MNYKKIIIIFAIAVNIVLSSITSNAIYSRVTLWGDEWKGVIPENDVLRLYEESYKLHYAVSINPTQYIDENTEGVLSDYEGFQLIYKPAKLEYSDPSFWKDWASSIYTEEYVDGALWGYSSPFSCQSFYKEIDGKVYFLEDTSDISLFDEPTVQLKKENYLYTNADHDECYYGVVAETMKGDQSSISFDDELPQNNIGIKFPTIANIDSEIKDVIYADKSDCTGTFIFVIGKHNTCRRFYTVSFVKENDNWKINGGEILNWYASGTPKIADYLNSADKVYWERTLNSQVAKLRLEEILSAEYKKDITIDRIICWAPSISYSSNQCVSYGYLLASKEINNGEVFCLQAYYDPILHDFTALNYDVFSYYWYDPIISPNTDNCDNICLSCAALVVITLVILKQRKLIVSN